MITVEEYYEMGFTARSDEEAERCIKRAGYIIGALTDGRAAAALEEGGSSAELIRQAVGFQAQQLCDIQTEVSDTEETVALGDFSYKQKSSSGAAVGETDYRSSIIGLLRSAGVMFGGVRACGG